MSFIVCNQGNSAASGTSLPSGSKQSTPSAQRGAQASSGDHGCGHGWLRRLSVPIGVASSGPAKLVAL